MANKARHAFGSEANIDTALANGSIDAFDILFLDEKKIGWIDKNGQKVILEDAKQVSVVDSLPETGEQGILYIVVDATNPEAVKVTGNIWDGTNYLPTFTSAAGGVDESTVDQKIEEAMSIVEF